VIASAKHNLIPKMFQSPGRKADPVDSDDIQIFRMRPELMPIRYIIAKACISTMHHSNS